MSLVVKPYTTFRTWLDTVPEDITKDALWSMEVYRVALFASDIAWRDVAGMRNTLGTRELVDQLYRAVCSIGANIAEGYSRSSGKDRRRFFEYSLGSARESRDWYYKTRHTLGERVTLHRIELHTSLIKQLLSLIPKQTEYSIRETQADYSVDHAPLSTVDLELDEMPIPFNGE